MKAMAKASAAAFTLLILFPAVAQASPLLELVGGVSGQGGLCARVAGSDAASTYFNPALLASAESGITLGYFTLAERMKVDLHSRQGAGCDNGACDVPVVNGAGPESFRRADNSPIQSPTLPTVWLQEGRADSDGALTLTPRPRGGATTGSSAHVYALLGIVQQIVKERITIGLVTMLPLSGFLTTESFYNDEREQFFSNSVHPELYGDRLTPVSLAFGTGVRVTDTLSLGLSLGLNISSSASAPVYVSNLANLDSVLIDSSVTVAMAVAPHVGASWTPVKPLRLAATVHTPQSVEVVTKFRYVIATGTEQAASQSFVHDYVPYTFGLGAEWDLHKTETQRWAAVATSTYALWSNYRDRHGETPRGAYAWSDVFAGAVGVRYDQGAFRNFLDLGYQPSPVPAQRGRSNYADGDRGSMSLGTTYGFELAGQQASVGFQAQMHRVFPQDVRKTDLDGPDGVRDEVPDDAIGGLPRGPIMGREGLQTNNPGYPGFRSDGFLFGGGVSFSLAY